MILECIKLNAQDLREIRETNEATNFSCTHSFVIAYVAHLRKSPEASMHREHAEEIGNECFSELCWDEGGSSANVRGWHAQMKASAWRIAKRVWNR